MAEFVHLHNHSEYSLLDGLSRIDPMVEYAKRLGMKAIAITDHGNLYGAIKFYKKCVSEDIKPIIGCEIYVAKRSLTDKEAGVDKDYNHLILLAKDLQGYKNLLKIITVSHLEGFYYKPRTDVTLLKKYSEGLICLTACLNGYVGEPLLEGKETEGRKRLTTLIDIYGKENLFLEIQRHIHVPPQAELNEKLIGLSREYGVGLIATNDNHYIEKEDAEAQELLLCIGTQTTLLDEGRKLSMIDSPDFYIKSAEEMNEAFKDIPEAITNSIKIADMCNLELTLGKWIMPQYEVPKGMTTAGYFKELIEERLPFRYAEVTDEIRERINYEIDVILKKGYETYFLTVADFVNWAKDSEKWWPIN